jgi:hypothetical protein
MAMVFSLRKFVRNTRLHADVMVRHFSNGSMLVTSRKIREIQGNNVEGYPHPIDSSSRFLPGN